MCYFDKNTFIIESTGAESILHAQSVQSLWSGYGDITRYMLKGGARASVIVKHIQPPSIGNHPRGWDTERSHQRKLRSYEVELSWYFRYSKLCSDLCRVPHLLDFKAYDGGVLIILEDLDATGYSRRVNSIEEHELQACIQWLAHFHATFLGCQIEGIWETGTYWHLETRPDELAVLEQEDPQLYAVAEKLDAILKASPYQSVVHGDAKLANFCFSKDGRSVAAVDFQYVGGGCGMKDLAYFVGSCLDEDSCAKRETELLDTYFKALRAGLVAKQSELDLDHLESDWRSLYHVAWTDFHRFLKGWSPGHWKLNGYSESVARKVIASIQDF